MSDSLQPHGTYSRGNSPGKNTGVGSLSLLQGIFSTRGSNPGLPHCRWIIYQLSHKGSPRVLEWVAYSFSRGIFQTQELNWGLLYCRQILYQLSYQGSHSPRASSILLTKVKLGLWACTSVESQLTPFSSIGHCRANSGMQL